MESVHEVNKALLLSQYTLFNGGRAAGAGVVSSLRNQKVVGSNPGAALASLNVPSV